MDFRKFYLVLASVVCAFSVFAAGFAPVRNFSRQSYGGGSQNWSMTQDPRGRVYFGNRDGMLLFDGCRWSLFRLPNYTTVRTVVSDSVTGRIYAGGTGEFGYYESGAPLMRPVYTSLSDSLPEKDRNFSEIWHIHLMGADRMVFQGDYSLFLSEGKKMTAIPVKEKITTSALIGHTLYVALQDGSVEILSGQKTVRLTGFEPLAGKRIVSILPFPGGKLLIATALHGLFLHTDGHTEPYNIDISSFLCQNQIFSAATDGSNLVFGTVNRGAVVKNISSGRNTYINKETGLQDNTVLGVDFDDSGNIWLCLDNGLSYAAIDSPIYDFLGASSEAGAGYASLLKGNTLFLATNRGLFSTTYPVQNAHTPPPLSRLLSGQVWNIDSIGSDIFFSTDAGLFISQGTAVPRGIEGIPQGCWSVAMIQESPEGRLALASTYHGFYLLSDRGGWHSLGKVEGYDEAGGKFLQDDSGYIWLPHWIKGLYRLKLSPDERRFTEVRLYNASDGLPNDRDNLIFTFNGQLRFSTASGSIYMLGSDGKMQKDKALSEALSLKVPAHILSVGPGEYFAFSPHIAWNIKEENGKKITIDSITFNPIASSLIPGFEHVGRLDGANLLVSHQDGFYTLNLEDPHNIKHPWSVYVETLYAGDSLIFSNLPADVNPEIKIPYNLNSLTFEFASPEYRAENAVLYSYRLDNYDKDWSAYSVADSKEYTQLTEGKYTFRLRAFNTLTGQHSEYELPLAISPPWYRSTVAKIIYLLLIIGVIFAAYRLIRYYAMRNAVKIRRQKEEEMERMRKEAEREALEKDYEIAALKSDRLEQDIKHKSSELSNITMNVIRKNEILLDISSKLNRLQGKANEKEASAETVNKEVEKIQQLIHENISHDDDWKRFNQNFDIVYANFTQTLSEMYPDLTVSELRLCCYLKMGLSSKDIAPLLSISPKSVEMNRYRLRKKMGLSRDVNLQAFLQKLV